MSGSFEGDLIRPLGLVTLNFGYAEAEVNRLLSDLKSLGQAIDIPQTAPLGQKLAVFTSAVSKLGGGGAAMILSTLESAKPLIERRNQLVHASVLAGGRVKPNDSTKSEFRVTVDDLNNLAEQIFMWKETLSVSVQKQILPALREKARNGT